MEWVAVVLGLGGIVGTGIGCWLGGSATERARHAAARADAVRKLPPKPRTIVEQDTPRPGPVTRDQHAENLRRARE